MNESILIVTIELWHNQINFILMPEYCSCEGGMRIEGGGVTKWRFHVCLREIK